MNRRQALAAMLGLPVLGAASTQATNTERLAITVDGREVKSWVVEKVPFQRYHRVELTHAKAGNRYYALAKTGEDDIAELKRLQDRGELGQRRACGAPEHA